MEFERIANAIGEVLEIDPSTITPESKFVDDLGADSLDVLEIVMGIEDEFGIKVPTDAATSIVTVGDAFEAIKKALQ
ncbi:MAG: acyl carrier protein [Eubacterium sp.]|nr:acyl carrier protein [Eubacterium sp.]